MSLEEDLSSLESLEEAIALDDHNLLERCLQGICIPEYRNENGESLLHLAAKNGNFCLTNYFLQAGCDVNSKDDSNKVPIEVATQPPHRWGCPAVVKLLIEAGADMNVINSWGQSLMISCFYPIEDWDDDLETAEILLDKGVDVHSKDRIDNTPLHIAAQFCKTESVNFLLANGGNPNVKNDSGETPLHYASMVKMNIHHDDDRNSALKYLRRRQYKLLKNLLEHGADVNMPDVLDVTPFHLVLQFGDLEAVPLFLDHGADLNKKDFRGNIAARCAAKNKDVNVLSLLVNLKKINLEEQSGYGVTAIHNAVKYCLLDNIKFLLEKGVNINCNVDGYTLLYNTIRSFEIDDDFDRERLIDFLIDLGADINERGYHGEMIIELPELEDVSYNHYLIKFILRFFAKHKFFGKEVSAEQLEVIEEEDLYTNYFDECMRELSEIQKLIFDDIALILPIFLGNREVKARYAPNERLSKKYDMIDFPVKFPIYGKFLKEMFAQERNKSILKIHAFEVIANALPRQIQINIIINNIIENLSIEDLVKTMTNHNYYFINSFKDLHVPEEYEILYGI